MQFAWLLHSSMYSFFFPPRRETINQLKMSQSCTSKLLAQSVHLYAKMLSWQKTLFSNDRIQFDMLKEHIRKLKVHPSDSAFWSTSFMQVCYKGKKRKITTLICNLCYPYLVHAMHRIWLPLCTFCHATPLAWWSISSFILCFPHTLWE